MTSLSDSKASDSVAGDYNEYRYASSEFGLDSPVEMSRIRRAVELIAAFSPRKVLDVGCTDGIVSGMIRKRIGCNVVGVDASAAALAKAKSVCDEVHQVMLGAETIPIPANSVDAVYAGEILEHVFYTENFLEDLRRVTRSGGVLVLTTPNLAAWFNRVFVLLGQQPLFTDNGVRFSNNGNFLTQPSLPAGHIRNFTASSLRHILKATGWKIEKLHGHSILGNKLRPLDRVISRVAPSFASDLMIVCRKV